MYKHTLCIHCLSNGIITPDKFIHEAAILMHPSNCVYMHSVWYILVQWYTGLMVYWYNYHTCASIEPPALFMCTVVQQTLVTLHGTVLLTNNFILWIFRSCIMECKSGYQGNKQHYSPVSCCNSGESYTARQSNTNEFSSSSLR